MKNNTHVCLTDHDLDDLPTQQTADYVYAFMMRCVQDLYMSQECLSNPGNACYLRD